MVTQQKMVKFHPRTMSHRKHKRLFPPLSWQAREADFVTMQSPIFESWQVALPLRVATLVRVEPLHRFEATKASRSIDLSLHDLRTLSLMVSASATQPNARLKTSHIR